MRILNLRESIRNIPNFPKQGIVFRDITTLLKNKDAFARAIDQLAHQYKTKRVDKVVGIEARGFILGSTLAYKLKCGFVPARKPKKLPSKTVRQEYKLEYGTDALEIHEDAISPGERILIVDDLLATGGTAVAACKLVEQLRGEIVGLAFLVELCFLHGRDLLKEYEIFSLIKYDSE